MMLGLSDSIIYIEKSLQQMLLQIGTQSTLIDDAWFDPLLFKQNDNLNACILESLELAKKLSEVTQGAFSDNDSELSQHIAQRLSSQYQALSQLLSQPDLKDRIKQQQRQSKKEANKGNLSDWGQRSLSELYLLLSQYQQWRYQLEQNYQKHLTNYHQQRLKRALTWIEKLELYIEQREKR